MRAKIKRTKGQREVLSMMIQRQLKLKFSGAVREGMGPKGKEPNWNHRVSKKKETNSEVSAYYNG